MPNPPLTIIDLVCLVMDSQVRPLDFALILTFDREFDAGTLADGAASARNFFPSTGCRVADGCWSRLDESSCESAFGVVRCREQAAQIDRFIETPFNLATEPPLRQVWVSDVRTGRGCLVTRIHHCAADLLSGLAWINHQLLVARGLLRPCSKPARLMPPTLAPAPAGAKRNPVWDRCGPLWTRPGRPSGERRWSTFSFPAGPLAQLSRIEHGFTFNDVLLVAALETLHDWNRAHEKGTRRVGLWLPVNIRQDSFSGFGNASSRVRVRREYDDGASPVEQCRSVRAQVNRARERGEWVVPETTVLSKIPLRFSAPAVRRYLNRPWADMGTAAFSHVQRWPGQDDPVFGNLQEFGVLGSMHRRHALMFASVTGVDRTWMTISYDPALLWAKDIESIRQRYLGVLEEMAERL